MTIEYQGNRLPAVTGFELDGVLITARFPEGAFAGNQAPQTILDKLDLALDRPEKFDLVDLVKFIKFIRNAACYELTPQSVREQTYFEAPGAAPFASLLYRLNVDWNMVDKSVVHGIELISEAVRMAPGATLDKQLLENFPPPVDGARAAHQGRQVLLQPKDSVVLPESLLQEYTMSISSPVDFRARRNAQIYGYAVSPTLGGVKNLYIGDRGISAEVKLITWWVRTNYIALRTDWYFPTKIKTELRGTVTDSAEQHKTEFVISKVKSAGKLAFSIENIGQLGTILNFDRPKSRDNQIVLY